jgi:hypothetical protein
VNKQILYILFLFLSHGAGAQTIISKTVKLGREYYVEDLTSKINVSLFTYNAKNSFSYDSKGKIDYQPNEYLGIGIKVMHKWLGLAYVYAPTNLQEKSKGTTKYSNFTLNSYGKKIGFRFLLPQL